MESAPAVEASLEDALSSAVRELGAADGEKEGTLSSGARFGGARRAGSTSRTAR